MSERREDEDDFKRRHRQLYDYAVAIGHVCFAWSSLEVAIDSLLMLLTGLYGNEDAELVTSNINSKNKLEVIKAAGFTKKLSDDWFARLTEAINKITQLTSRRNSYIHDLYWPMESGVVMLQEARTRLKKIKGGHAVVSAEAEIIPTQIWDLVHAIHDVDRELDEIMSEFREANP